jgi:hypothetical protein
MSVDLIQELKRSLLSRHSVDLIFVLGVTVKQLFESLHLLLVTNTRFTQVKRLLSLNSKLPITWLSLYNLFTHSQLLQVGYFKPLIIPSLFGNKLDHQCIDRFSLLFIWHHFVIYSCVLINVAPCLRSLTNPFWQILSNLWARPAFLRLSLAYQCLHESAFILVAHHLVNKPPAAQLIPPLDLPLNFEFNRLVVVLGRLVYHNFDFPRLKRQHNLVVVH